MKLHKIKLKNFRCYKDETEILFKDLTAIIGKNDIGKSTILEALDAFFNDNIDASDLSKDCSEQIIELSCIFKNVPDRMVLDSSEETIPEEEGILNAEGLLEIKKVYDYGGSRKSTSIYLIANYPNHEDLDGLLNMNNAKLKNHADALGISLEGVNRRKNPELRAAIRNNYSNERAIAEIKLEGNIKDNDDNIKKIWTSLKKQLPIYSLFKSDKSFDDKDGDISDPMQMAIKEALALDEVKEMLAEVEGKVKEFSTQVADKTIQKLKQFDSYLSETLKSEFGKNPTYNKVFDINLMNDQGIPLNKRGSGVRRLVILSFFQAQAERRKVESNAPSIIYGIEEPETSQHPNHQIMIVNALKELSEQDKVQVCFTTHSANLAKEISLESLCYVCKNDSDAIEVNYGVDPLTNQNNDNAVKEIIKTLGILPNPTDSIKVLVYVEGYHDVEVLKRYSEIWHLQDNNVINLRDTDSVGYVVTGGSTLRHYLDNGYLDGLGRPCVHIYDRDVADYQKAVNDINTANDPEKKAFNTNKMEMENYLHPDAIKEAYQEDGKDGVEIIVNDNDKVPLQVAEKIYVLSGKDWEALDQEKKKEKAQSKKKLLNSLALKKMDYARLYERGGSEEIRTWLDAIKGYAS